MAESRNKNLIKAISNALVNGKITTAGVLVPDIVEDTSPQLGGNLDVNGSDIVSTSDGNIDILPNGAGKVNLDGNGSTGGITVSDGLIEMRTSTGSVASIDMYCEVNNAHKVTIKPPAHANYSGNVTFQLPSSNGTNGYVLQTNGSGVTSWVAQTGGDVVDDTSPQLGGNLDLNGNDIQLDGTDAFIDFLPSFENIRIRNTNSSGSGNFINIESVGAIQLRHWTGSGTENMLIANGDGSVDIYYDNSKKFETTNTGVQTTGTLSINGAYTFPTTDGNSAQVLTTDGSGSLSFASVGSLAGAGIQNVSDDTSPQLGGNLDLNSNNITGTGNISTTGTMSLTNTTTNDTLLLTTTEDSSTAAPVLTFKRNSGSPADADYIGQLKFKGENDADQEVVYAKITGKISDASDTTEDGLIEFALRKAGANNIGARLTSTELKLINGTGLEVAGLTYPTADGSADQVLTTNGSGTLSFADAASSGATPYQYTATAGQTSFTGSDDNGNTLSYTAGKTLVYQNGVLLTPVDDYTASSGNSVVLVTAAELNDVIIIAALGTATATVNSSSTSNVLYEHANSINSAYSITSGNNAMSAGPITVESGGSVTVPTGSSWVVV